MSARPRFRTAALAAVVASLVAGTLLVAWQLAAARVPRHRAALERLVQAHTGLDVRFHELGLRWGWYGPEAVFRDVELGEPGRSSTLLRAPELTVGFDAWRTVQTGTLRAGRVTLVAPEIDLAKRAASGDRSRPPVDLARVLGRWQGGRVDVESASVRLPLGEGSVTLRIPRGTLRRADDLWSAGAQVQLPERLGRSARVSMRLAGDPATPQTLSGSLRFEGQRLALPAWRELLLVHTPSARHVPAAGSGNVEVSATVARGRIDRLVGEVTADDVQLASLPAVAHIGYLTGKWTASRRDEGWRLDITNLKAGPNGRDATPAALALDLQPARKRAHAQIDLVSLEMLASAAQGWLPQLSLGEVQVGGIAHRVVLDWDGARQPGSRLTARADATDVSVSVASRGFSLSRASARLAATDAELAVELESPAAELGFGGAHSRHWSDVALASRVLVRATKAGWELSTDRLIARHRDGELSLSGQLAAARGKEPRLSLRASIADASLEAVRDMLFAGSSDGARLSGIGRGRIESGEFELVGPLEAAPRGAAMTRFRGALAVRDASVAGTGSWPSLEDIDAQVTWSGDRFRAEMARGHASGIQITSAEAHWSAGADAPLRINGQAFGRIEHGLDWLRGHAELQAAARHLQLLDARGDALLDFRLAIPVTAGEAPSVRLALSLEGARVAPARAIPAVESLRGTLVLEDGRLQRSTLSGRWLGGPVTLRLAERRDREGAVVTELRAQGLLDAAQVARAARISGADRLAGSSAWTGVLAVSATPGGASLAGHAETTLSGVASALPDPLVKARDEALPLRIDLEARPAELPQVHVTASERMRGAFALALTSEGWSIERGSLRIGPGDATLPGTPAFVLAGRVARLDLPAWLAVSRASADEGSRPPLWAELAADVLDIAGRAFRDVHLTAREDDTGLHLSTASEALTATLHVPNEPSAQRPIEVALARLDVPAAAADASIGGLIASLAPAAVLRAEEVTWEGRQLGRLHAALASDDEGVRVDSVRLTGAAHELEGAARCAPSFDTCRIELDATTADAARTLRDFAFADEIEAQRGRLSAQLDWQRHRDRPWLASLDGRLSLSLERGSVKPAAVHAGTPFALLAMPAMIAHADAAAGTASADAPRRLDFRRLTGDYTLRDGQAHTSNLHFDGDAEILTRGRVGLADRDYDQVAWVLEGEERLPSVVRRLGATPRVAAAWLSLRDWFGGPEIEDSRAVLHLHGSWTRPIVGPPAQDGAAP